jgi:hypothetical protein
MASIFPVSLAQLGPQTGQRGVNEKGRGWASGWPQGGRKGNSAMIKTLEAITELIRNPKPSFRQAEDRPQKAKKHRYERRKIKEIIRLGDWMQENPA